MDTLKDLKVDTNLSGKQLEEICSSICFKYYLPKLKCIETNRWVKETHTKRSLQSISRFIKLLFKWSKIGHSIVFKIKYLNSIKIPDNSWRMAKAFLYSETRGHTKQIYVSNVYKLTRGNEE